LRSNIRHLYGDVFWWGILGGVLFMAWG